jgi:dephospho-CoA kinase
MAIKFHIHKIGITGGIGTGKSTVCQIFAELGIPIYYADERAKWLLVEDKGLVASIKALFGDSSYFPDGRLNRKYLAEIAFSDPAKLAMLNALVHPAVERDTLEWYSGLTNRDCNYSLREAALLFESGSDRFLDKVIVVSAPLDLRIERVIKRDNTTSADVLKRIANQMPEEEKLKRADFVINNDGIQLILPQVMEIHNQLLATHN